mmetsp:Transcript_1675/g.2340  ORF Transcript_1675/g.2340 Transcript_1675/m.2340 type:complete len:572 (+) Transcript_1675:34-1749(+)
MCRIIKLILFLCFTTTFICIVSSIEQPQTPSIDLNFSIEQRVISRQVTENEEIILANIHLEVDDQLETRPNVDLVIVMDESGSMRPERSTVQQFLKFVASQLLETDRLSLVSFDSEASISLPLTQMDVTGRQSAIRAIESYNPSGATNLEDGLFKGFSAISNAKQHDEERQAITSLLVLTDGWSNVGITDRSEMFAAVQSRFDQDKLDSIFLHTFGFSSNHDDLLLKGLAEIGKGSYYVLEDATDFEDTFADCVGGLLSTVATNVRIDLSSIENHYAHIESIWSQYEHKQVESGMWREDQNAPVESRHTVHSIFLNDLQAGEQRDILFRVRFLPVPDSDETTFGAPSARMVPVQFKPIVQATLSYYSPLSDTNIILSAPFQPLSVARESLEAMNGYCSLLWSFVQQDAEAIDIQRNRMISVEALEAVEALRSNFQQFQAMDKMSIEETIKTMILPRLEKAIDEIQSSISHEAPLTHRLLSDLETLKAQFEKEANGKNDKGSFLNLMGVAFGASQEHATQRVRTATENKLSSYQEVTQDGMATGSAFSYSTKHMRKFHADKVEFLNEENNKL